MTKLEISEVVLCPDQMIDMNVSDCCGCEFYEGKENDGIFCNFKEEK